MDVSGHHGGRRAPRFLDTGTLDRIDDNVNPGVVINPADTTYGAEVLQPTLRRR
jgi:hypothetical protein